MAACVVAGGTGQLRRSGGLGSRADRRRGGVAGVISAVLLARMLRRIGGRVAELEQAEEDGADGEGGAQHLGDDHLREREGERERRGRGVSEW